MIKEIIVPPLGESVTEATISRWLKHVGDSIKLDEPLVELETDKVTIEINSPQTGVLSETRFLQGQQVKVGSVIGFVDSEIPEKSQKETQIKEDIQESPQSSSSDQSVSQPNQFSPAVRKMVAENNINPLDIQGTGKAGRLIKEDIQHHLDDHEARTSSHSIPTPETQASTSISQTVYRRELSHVEPEKRVKMSRLRLRIAERLKEAQNTAAMLTTFNEVDMTQVMMARDLYRDKFEKRYGIRLGMMSFFAKATIAALQEIPALNAEIQRDEIVYKNHYDIGVAVSTPNGLVVPVVRNADLLNFSEIELMIADMGQRAQIGKLTLDELTGGTFTITNGGVFGSLMSTPIINPPQTGILGMHKIEKRPVVINDQIVIRPMMYIALTYDHRIIDGREAVTFLVRVKEYIEDLQRLLIGI
ncbi:MAG: 2-oxoglutarate dehydrogenase complex dihydrolipoyllysine-residue succinyltransferase [Candidatus Paracaedimonas acanthamoebae]|uniref:Dihydrolipoyllysine-residue succinyltransferase component of 2-oxoglutarate dehydrogenase complex n=1 Tax=Candidatus Paracaedimonas acanthamoebae TaxID=244581 RepID=A0A8J7PR80_9PROT|nr:2-oxoglutarate dehydrogenase complex dihydrolipoyllysine-residue succinyltransferase [Candidatus Paracaedimonas acanthamoebae]